MQTNRHFSHIILGSVSLIRCISIVFFNFSILTHLKGHMATSQIVKGPLCILEVL